MPGNEKNLVLIGMPGSGKSTVGVVLAKKLSMGFIDTDVLIQTTLKRPLQDIVDSDGYMALRQVEEQTLVDLAVEKHVVSTGGSAVYSQAAMEHLRSNGITIYLDVSLDGLRKRIDNFDSRGIARRPGQSFSDLFEERARLYRQYADYTIDCNNLPTADAVCQQIISALKTSPEQAGEHR